MLPLWDSLQDEQLTSLLFVPGALQIALFTLSVHGLFSLPSLQEQLQCPLRSIRAEPSDFYNSRCRASLASRTHKIQSLSLSKIIAMGINVSHALPFGSLFLTLDDCCSLPISEAMIPLFLRQHPHISYLYQCDLFSTSCCAIC